MIDRPGRGQAGLAGLAGRLRPMLAVAGELPADDTPWAYEMKWDGIRAIAFIDDGAVTLVTRRGRDATDTYPELRGMAAAVGSHLVVLDGEIVALGGGAWPSFEALQQRMNIASSDQARQLAAQIPVTYLGFDLLVFDDSVLIDQPYSRRRERLDQLGLDGRNWQTPPAFTGVSGADVRAVSRQHGLEGIMAKRLDSPYEPGKRSTGWRKIKNLLRQEFVVGGWKPGVGNRTNFVGSLLLGVHEPAGLMYAGHVGTGFSSGTLRVLNDLLAPLRRADSPFGGAVPAEHARSAVWVEPEIVIEAEFRQWTNAGRVRMASYLGLRSDKDPAEVVREPSAPD